MSSNRPHDKAKSHSESAQQRNECLPLHQTPVKRQPHSHNSFLQDLSPLPFPLKKEIALMDPPGQFISSQDGLRIIETPVVRQPSKFMPYEEGAQFGIEEKVIFESSEEDGNNNSSSMEESSSCSEEPSHASQFQEPEDVVSSCSEVKHSRPEQHQTGSSGDNERENKGRRNPKSRVSTTPKETNSGKKVFCNCKKTKCLKLYCDCFRLNQTCEGCNCVGCHNLDIYNEERNNAILALMDRNPDPFGQKIEDDKHVKGCNCKKSNCLKKYCECYQAGLKCGDNCKCQECKNTPLPDKSYEGDRGPAIAKNTAKKERKMVQI